MTVGEVVTTVDTPAAIACAHAKIANLVTAITVAHRVRTLILPTPEEP